MKRILLSLLVAATLLVGCGRQPKTYPNALLASVPADTPYLIASGEPMPEELSRRFREGFQPALDNIRARVDQGLNELTEKNPEAAQQFRSLVDELMNVIGEDGLKEIGITRDDSFVLYGDGLFPVMRLTLSDAKAFRSFIDRLMSKAGIVVSPHNFQGADYWQVPVGHVVVMAGIGNGEFDAALTAPDRQQATLETLFGGKSPGKSVEQAGTVASLVKQYGFTDNAIGYLDSVRIADLVLGSGDAPGLLDDIGAAPDTLTPGCRSELREFVGKAPRVAFGYEQLTSNRMKSRGIVELEPGLAGDLKSWTVPVPGLGADSDARFSLGFGLDAGKAMATVQRWMGDAANRQFACESLSGVNWSEASGKINSAPLYMVGNPKGFVLRLDDLSMDKLPEAGLANADVSVKASLVMLLDNAQTLPAMAKSFVPQLQSVDIPKDGTPIRLPQDMLQGFKEPAFAAANDTVLGLSLGDGGEQRLKDAMAAKAVNSPPVLHVSFDAGWFYGHMAEWLPQVASATGGPDSDTGKALDNQAKMMAVYAKLFGRVDNRIQFTDRGIEFAQDVTLQ